MIDAWILWCIVGGVLILVGLGMARVLPLCLGVGCFAAMLTRVAGGDSVWQFVVFFGVVSGTVIPAFTVLRPYSSALEKHLKVLWRGIGISVDENFATNSDALIGQAAMVTKAIPRDGGKGYVSIRGQSWPASHLAGTGVAEGQTVIVRKVQGATLIIE